MQHPALPLLEVLRSADGAAFDAALQKLSQLPLGQLTQAEIGQLLGAIESTEHLLKHQQADAAQTLRGLRQGVTAANAYKAGR